MGTFQSQRREMYAAISDGTAVACVLTGHSHRKAMYLLGAADGKGYPTQGYAMRSRDGGADPASHTEGRPAIIVSDSAGPLPRLNLQGEFGGYGSDRPSGTLVTISDAGDVTHIEPVCSDQPKPRLAVAVDYMQIMKGFVFKEIRVTAFQRANPKGSDLLIQITFHEYFPDGLAEGMIVTLYGKASTSKDDPWTDIDLDPQSFTAQTKSRDNRVIPAVLRFRVQQNDRGSFMDWLQYGSQASRFMSFHFSSAAGLDDVYDVASRWNIAVDAKPSWWNDFHSGAQEYEILPPSETGFGDSVAWTPDAVPDFTWRRKAASGG
jgi:hypothetical protein